MEAEKIEEKIKKSLIQSGFPLELETTSILEEKDWLIFPNEYIYDDDACEEHEVDVISLKTVERLTSDKKFKLQTRFKIIIECKKSEKHPWVFFMRNKQAFDKAEKMIKHCTNFGTSKPFRLPDHKYYDDLDYFASIINYNKLELFSWSEKSTNYCQAFKDPNKENQIYCAIKSIIRPLKTILRKERLDFSRGRWENPIINTYVPIIVLDGLLFQGKLLKKDLEITSAHYIPLVINSGDNGVGRILIHIVTINYLAEFLDRLNLDINKLQGEFSNIEFIKPTN